MNLRDVVENLIHNSIFQLLSMGIGAGLLWWFGWASLLDASGPVFWAAVLALGLIVGGLGLSAWDLARKRARGRRDLLVAQNQRRIAWDQEILYAARRDVERVEADLRDEKAAHAQTRKRLVEAEAELSSMRSEGGR